VSIENIDRHDEFVTFAICLLSNLRANQKSTKGDGDISYFVYFKRFFHSVFALINVVTGEYKRQEAKLV